MLTQEDIRFSQKFNNFLKAFKCLEEAVNLMQKRKLSYLEKLGLIHYFECVLEIFCNLVRSFVTENGAKVCGLVGTIQEAAKVGVISNVKVWMEMIKSRSEINNTYDRGVAEEIVEAISKKYFVEFVSFKTHSSL